MATRGGNRGGGTTIRHVRILTERAATELKRKAKIDGPRYTKEAADQAITRMLEDSADRRLLYLSDELLEALPYIRLAREQCFSTPAQRGLEELAQALAIGAVPGRV